MNNILTGALILFRRKSVIVAIVLVVGTVFYKWQAYQIPPLSEIPHSQQPQPNARIYFNIAADLLRDDIAHVSLGTPLKDVKDEQRTYHKGEDFFPPLAERERIVADNVPAFHEVEKGLRFSFCEAPDRSLSASTALYNEMRRYRSLVMAFRVASEVSFSKGDLDHAVRYDLDSMDIGADLPRGSGCSGMMAGNSSESIGRNGLFKLVDHLSESDAKLAAQQVARINESEVPLTQTLTEEKWTKQGWFIDLTSRKQWRTFFEDSWSFDNQSVTPYQMLMIVEESLDPPRLAYDNLTQYDDALIVRSRLPWKKQLGSPPIPQSSDPDSRICEFDDEDWVRYHYCECALNRLLETELALRAYKLDHNGLPKDLRTLAPTYIPTVPLDPFSDGQELRYRKTTRSFVLYSIGPDATDNGGAPVVNTTWKYDRYRLWPFIAFKGDIVSGINY